MNNWIQTMQEIRSKEFKRGVLMGIAISSLFWLVILGLVITVSTRAILA